MGEKSQDKLKTIGIIITILVGITIILAYLGYDDTDKIKKVFDNSDEGDPFNITITPSFIEEGPYTGYNNFPEQIPITFTLNLNKDKNITYIKLDQNAVIIDRKDKTSQTKVSTISWTNKHDYDPIFYKDSNSYSFSESLKAEGKLWGCQNCFMGEDRPYIFTFPITYVEDGGSKQVYSVKVEFPIV